MSNIILMLLLAIVVVFVIARMMKDAKAFTKLMAILAVSALVGAGVKQAIASTPNKATVVSTEAVPTQDSISPFVLEDTVACPDPVSKEKTARDSVETEVEGLPTVLIENGIQDDS